MSSKNKIFAKYTDENDDIDCGSLQSGISLDCARRYYSVATIIQLIDVLTENGGSFLQLHLTDNQNVGVECNLLGQTANRAVKLTDGSYQNPQTGKQFLLASEISDILDYASHKHIAIIPEIDAPAHMEGFFTLADNLYGRDYVDTLAYSRRDYPGELDIASEAAIRFVQVLYDEYARLFNRCRYFHIGCDELWSGSSRDKTAYIQNLSSYMKKKGFTVRMWNDLLIRDNIADLDHTIQVTYWSWDGEVQDAATKEVRRSKRASVPDLQEAGFEILIYNAYYLYYVPSLKNFNTHDNDYTVNDLKDNWTIKNWDSNTGRQLAATDHIIGSAVSMWSEDSAPLSTDQIVTQFIRQFEAMSWVNKNRQ